MIGREVEVRVVESDGQRIAESVGVSDSASDSVHIGAEREQPPALSRIRCQRDLNQQRTLGPGVVDRSPHDDKPAGKMIVDRSWPQRSRTLWIDGVAGIGHVESVEQIPRFNRLHFHAGLVRNSEPRVNCLNDVRRSRRDLGTGRTESLRIFDPGEPGVQLGRQGEGRCGSRTTSPFGDGQVLDNGDRRGTRSGTTASRQRHSASTTGQHQTQRANHHRTWLSKNSCHDRRLQNAVVNMSAKETEMPLTFASHHADQRSTEVSSP